MLYYTIGTAITTDGGSQKAANVCCASNCLARERRQYIVRFTVADNVADGVLSRLVCFRDVWTIAPRSNHRTGGRVAAALGRIYGRPACLRDYASNRRVLCDCALPAADQARTDQRQYSPEAFENIAAHHGSPRSTRAAIADCIGIARHGACIADAESSLQAVGSADVHPRRVTFDSRCRRSRDGIACDDAYSRSCLVAQYRHSCVQHRLANRFVVSAAVVGLRGRMLGSAPAARHKERPAAAHLLECRGPTHVDDAAPIWCRLGAAMGGASSFSSFKFGLRGLNDARY